MYNEVAHDPVIHIKTTITPLKSTFYGSDFQLFTHKSDFTIS